MPHVTAAQRAELLRLTRRMRTIALRAGPLHSFWDIIVDIEAFVVGERTMLHHSAEAWITLATEALNTKEVCYVHPARSLSH